MIIIGIESGTSFAPVNGTKTFTITGLAGLLTKNAIKSVILTKDTGNIVLINSLLDNRPTSNTFTITENTGVYTIDYSGIVTSPALPTLSTGDNLVITCELSGLSKKLNTDIAAVKAQTQSIEGKVDNLGGLTTDYTFNKIITNNNGFWITNVAGAIKSLSSNITELYIDNIAAVVGSNVNVGSKIAVVTNNASNAVVVIKTDSVVETESDALEDADTTINNIAPATLTASEKYGFTFTPCDGATINPPNQTTVDLHGNIVSYNGNLTNSAQNISATNYIEDATHIYIAVKGTTRSGIEKINKSTGVLEYFAKTGTFISLYDYGNYIIAVGQGTATLKIEKSSMTTSATLSAVNLSNPYGLIVGDYMFIVNNSGTSLYVVNLADLSYVTVAIAGVLVAIKSHGGFVYSVTGTTLYKHNATTGAILGTLTVTGLTNCKSIFAYGNYLYLQSSANNGFYKIDVTGGAFSLVGGILTANVSLVGKQDESDSRYAYCINTNADILTFRLDTETLVKTTVTGMTTTTVGTAHKIAQNTFTNQLAIGRWTALGIKIYNITNLQ
jgi:hypothetical protein